MQTDKKKWMWHHTHRWLWISFLIEFLIIITFIAPIKWP